MFTKLKNSEFFYNFKKAYNQLMCAHRTSITINGELFCHDCGKEMRAGVGHDGY